ncbi:MAG TPA: protein kinase [Kofleriaceae bacterium]
MSSDANHDSLIGEVLASRYCIEALIGEGAMGAVYRARHIKVGRAFAIKVLHPRFSGEERSAKRFAREAEVAGTLHHPNVVSVVDVGDLADGRKFLVMEYAEGITLLDLINDTAPMSPARMISLVRQLCNGLAHAHELGLIHRDFKPDNVIVERDRHGNETPRIVDFGTAILREDVESSTERLTTRGLVLGTPHYMSPEHATGQPIDHRIDLFALGVTCFEMMTGHSPFEGDGVDVARANLLQETPVMSVRVPGLLVDPLLEAFTRKLMNKQRDDRPATAVAARELIDLIEKDRPAAAIALGVPGDEVAKPRTKTPVPAQLQSQPIPFEVDVGDLLPVATPPMEPPGMMQPGQPGQLGMMQPGQHGMMMQPGWQQPGMMMQPGWQQPGQPGMMMQPGQPGMMMQPGQPGMMMQPGQPGMMMQPGWPQAQVPWPTPYAGPPQAWQRPPSSPPYAAEQPRFRVQPEATEVLSPKRPFPWRLVIPGVAGLAVLVTMVIAVRGHEARQAPANRVEYSSLTASAAANPPAAAPAPVAVAVVPSAPPIAAAPTAAIAAPAPTAVIAAPAAPAARPALATAADIAAKPARPARPAHADDLDAGAARPPATAAARTSALAPAPAAHPITMPMSASGVAELYASVGRQLKALDAARGSAAAHDLWQPYLRIRINEAISTPAKINEASAILYRIEDQVQHLSAPPR